MTSTTTTTSTTHAVPTNPIPSLFNHVSFFIHDSIHPDTRTALADLLQEWGAHPCPRYPPDSPRSSSTASTSLSPPRFDPAQLTHLITDTLDLPEYALVRPNTVHANDNVNANAKGKGLSRDSADRDPAHAINLVTPAWVTRSFDLQQLQPPRFYSPDPALYFSGTCICTSGLPETDTLAICAGVEALGGQWRRELTREVTHLICVAESGPKYDMAMKFGPQLGIAVVLPHWFEESLKLSQLVPIDIYRFPSPPFSTGLRDGSSTKPFAERLSDYWQVKLSSASTSSSTTSLPPNPTPNTATAVILGLEFGLTRSVASKVRSNETYFRSTLIDGLPSVQRARSGSLPLGSAASSSSTTNNAALASTTTHPRVFEGKKIYLASDLGLSAGMERALKAKIEQAGGKAWSFGVDGDREAGVAGDNVRGRRERDAWAKRRAAEKALRESQVVVMRTREGWEYWMAYDLALSIGTLPWLYHCFLSSEPSSPLSRLLHYPLPSRHGVDDFRDKVITVSNYAGPARDYVRALIETLGAKFEGTMGRATSFVVSASDHGSKAVYARQWSIPLVTHLWLEACVLSWSLLDPSLDPSYTLSSGANEGTLFTTVLGETGWSKEGIEKWADGEAVREERNWASRSVDELEKEERGDDVEMEDGGEGDDQHAMEVDEDQKSRAPERRPSPGAKSKSKGLAAQPLAPAPIPVPALSPAPAPLGARSPSKPPSKQKEKQKEQAEDDDVRVVEPRSPPRQQQQQPAPGSPVQTPRQTKHTPRRRSHSPSSSDLTPPPPSDKAISRHFSLVDEHNVLQRGSKRAAAAQASAALADAIKDKNAYEQEQRSSARKAPAGHRRRVSQETPAASRRKVKKEEDVAEGDDGDEADEPRGVVRRRGEKDSDTKGKGKGKKKTREVGTSLSDDENDVEIVAPPKKKVKAAAPVVTNGNVKPVNRNLKNATTQEGTTQEGGVISSFDNPPRAQPPPAAKTQKVKVISTGLGLDKNSPAIKALKPFGATWTDQPKDATHLVVKGISRTEKFLCCLPFAPKIVTKKWIDACNAAGKLVDETPYLLRDKAKEAELGDTLEAILARAKRGKLFEGKNVYVTKGVVPDPETMRRIIAACGGVVHLLKDLTKHHKKIVGDADRDAALVVSCAADRREWDKLAAQGIPIYSVEAVFSAALQQRFERGFASHNRVDAQLEK
ncbi:hypothetical protein JCM1840_005932 [Sporobolomyces johnsonii]